MPHRPGLRPAALAALLGAFAAPLVAQTTPASQNVELAPIACYWRTSTDAVRVGELFTLVLTCSVLDTAATTVVPDQSRFDPGALQLQPFEVRGGTQAPDLRTPNRRVFQYEYQLRYIGEDVGRDLQLPALTITYRVQSRVQQDAAAVESRERQYILPAHTVRVLAIVPLAARDIREAPQVTLAEIDARRFMASMIRIASWAFYTLGGVVALWALVATTRQRRARSTVAVRHVSDAGVLSAVWRELDAVRRARGGEGWTEALAARALAALRVAASYASSTPPSQTPARVGVAPLSGQIVVASAWSRGPGVLVSGAATTQSLARLHEGAPAGDSSRGHRLDTLQAAIARFSETTYGRPDSSTDALDAALQQGTYAVAAVRREYSWLAVQMRALKSLLTDGPRARGWIRS